MAFLGIFGKKSDDTGVRKHAERVANKRAQAFDRWDAIQGLGRLKTKESVEALLPRFTFYVEPSITDQEEKDAAFAAVVDAGTAALDPIVAFLRRADSISWPVKMLDRIVTPDVVVTQLLELLAGMSTEYERDPERKIQILTTLGERKDERIAQGAVRFLQDASEPVRFSAASAIIAQGEVAAHRDEFLQCVRAEESVRVRNRIFDGFAAASLSVAPEEALVQAKLTAGYALDKNGVPHKKS